MSDATAGDAPDRPAAVAAPDGPPRFLRPVADLRPGDRVCRAAVVVRTVRTATAVEVETDDGRAETYELAGDPVVEVE